MKKLQPLNYKALCTTLNPKQLPFETTAELKELTNFLGQARALDAISFGIGIKKQGYNLYAMGPTGLGKRSLIRKVLESKASTQKVPDDWCYIHNFEFPEKPIAIRLPPGMGSTLQQDMKSLISELSTSILAVFESDEYNAGMQSIAKIFESKKRKLGQKTAKKNDNKVPRLYKERHEQEKELQSGFTLAVIEPMIEKLKKKYEEFPAVIHYLSAVQKDVVEHFHEFVRRDETTDVIFFVLESPILIRYQVNLLVDNSKRLGAPVIFEEHPSYSNLICRVEHKPQLGSLLTNFTLIRPGSIHQANGGYLIIEIRKLKNEPHAWEGLKRALYAKKIVIEPVEHYTETTRTISLDPDSIPLDIKIVLLGDRNTFYTLCQDDPDFNELFKVAVDFDELLDRNPTTIQTYARLVGTIAKKDDLRPLHASAVAAVIDYSSRLAEDIEKLSTHVRSINDLILEADYWASTANKDVIEAIDIKDAIQSQHHRLDRTKQICYEDINRDFILINTDGKIIGQVNCLSVVRVGTFSYGHPTKLTATVRKGRGKIIDIQRAVKMAGPIHSKGGMILANFLRGNYNVDGKFSLTASFSFEQVYGMIEGDSASVGELCALLSALAEVPLKQSLAITGSINQLGIVQVVGGVNEKIEGFFDICRLRGLTGNQGVLIPAMNVKNLMLREDIVQAAKKGDFHIYPIATIDEAMTILTGIEAGKKSKAGKYPKNSINARVEHRLKLFSK